MEATLEVDILNGHIRFEDDALTGLHSYQCRIIPDAQLETPRFAWYSLEEPAYKSCFALEHLWEHEAQPQRCGPTVSHRGEWRRSHVVRVPMLAGPPKKARRTYGVRQPHLYAAPYIRKRSRGWGKSGSGRSRRVRDLEVNQAA